MKKKGQVWIETVLYTLIGLTLIGVALGFIMPRINEASDKALVVQAINSLSSFDEKITEVIQTGEGNIRPMDITMKKGELHINSSSDSIIFVLRDLAGKYSEPGVDVQDGRITVRTEAGQKGSITSLRASYNANITYFGKDGKDGDVTFTAASTPYKFLVENNGSINGRVWVDIREVSNR